MGKRNFEHAAAGDGGAAAGVLTTTDNQNSAPAKRIKLEAPLNASPSCCDQEFALRRELVDGAVLTDLAQKHWRVGKPIGKCPSVVVSGCYQFERDYNIYTHTHMHKVIVLSNPVVGLLLFSAHRQW